MPEVSIIVLRKQGDFDGVSAFSLKRDDLTATGQRLYQANVTGTAGVIDSEIFGLFGAATSKLVGIATSSNNPRAFLRVTSPGGSVREQVSLSARFQYVVVHGGDKLAIATFDSTPAQQRNMELSLAVNELNEHEHVQWGAERGVETHNHTRYRIIRTQGNFQLMLGSTWVPTFEWNESAALFEVTDNGNNGLIPIDVISPFPRNFGSLVSVRFSNTVPPLCRLRG
jgi:hypothetical protein